MANGTNSRDATKRIKFTKTSLEGILPPIERDRDTYYDTEIPSLAIRVTRSGAKTFYLVKRVGHKMIWHKLGTFPDLTVENARRAAYTALAEFASPEVADRPDAVRRNLRKMLTLNEFFEEYGKRYGHTKRAWRDDQQRFRDHLQPAIGTYKLSDRDSIKIALTRKLDAMTASGYANATRNLVRNLASGIFNKAIEWGYIYDNPIRGVPTLTPAKRRRFLRAHELPRFFAALDAEPNPDWRDFFMLALLTGARKEDLLAMRWDAVKLDEEVWSLARTKNGDPQEVTLCPEAVDILRIRLSLRPETKPSPSVFPSWGKSGHLAEPKKAWARIFDRDELAQLEARIALQAKAPKPTNDDVVGLSLERKLEQARALATKLEINCEGARMEHTTIHDLRRTLGSWQAKNGTSLLVIGKTLNHRNYQTTLRYAYVDDEPKTAVLAATRSILAAAGRRAEPADATRVESQQGA